MAYDSLENSTQAGAPVELYEWTYGATVWRQTSAETAQSYGGHTWDPIAMSRDEIDEGSEMQRRTLTIKTADNHPIADLFRAGPPEQVILLRLRRLHRGDSEAVLIFMGRLLNCEWAGIEATLSAEPVYTSIRSPGLRRMYSRLCPHVLYGTSCRLALDDWDSSATVSAVSGLVVSASGAHLSTAGYFGGGLLAWDSGAVRHWRAIESHSAAGQLRLVSPLPGLGAGAAVTLWPGCDKALKTCREKFANQPNFGGFKWIPGVNPFTTAVF